MQLNKVEVYFIEIDICVFEGKQRSKKCKLSLTLELVKVGGYDFPTHVMAPRNSHLFFFIGRYNAVPHVSTVAYDTLTPRVFVLRNPRFKVNGAFS
jgi:hypothetical protein